MAEEVLEEELLRSIEEVDAKLRDFRKRVQAVLLNLQSEGKEVAPAADIGTAS